MSEDLGRFSIPAYREFSKSWDFKLPTSRWLGIPRSMLLSGYKACLSRRFRSGHVARAFPRYSNANSLALKLLQKHKCGTCSPLHRLPIRQPLIRIPFRNRIPTSNRRRQRLAQYSITINRRHLSRSKIPEARVLQQLWLHGGPAPSCEETELFAVVALRNQFTGRI